MTEKTKLVRITDAVFIDGEPVDIGEELQVETGLANRLIGSNKAKEVKERAKKSEKVTA